MKIQLALICTAKRTQGSKKPPQFGFLVLNWDFKLFQVVNASPQPMPWHATQFRKKETQFRWWKTMQMVPFMVYCRKLCIQISYMARLEALWLLITNWRTTHTRDMKFTKTRGSSFRGSGLYSKFPSKCLPPLVSNKTLMFLKSQRNTLVPSPCTKTGAGLDETQGALGYTSVPTSHQNPSLES